MFRIPSRISHPGFVAGEHFHHVQLLESSQFHSLTISQYLSPKEWSVGETRSMYGLMQEHENQVRFASLILVDGWTKTSFCITERFLAPLVCIEDSNWAMYLLWVSKLEDTRAGFRTGRNWIQWQQPHTTYNIFMASGNVNCILVEMAWGDTGSQETIYCLSVQARSGCDVYRTLPDHFDP